MKTIKLNVEGMSCQHCVNRVKKAVEALDGVSTVNVELENSTVEVEFDPAKASEKDFKEAITDRGYDVV